MKVSDIDKKYQESIKELQILTENQKAAERDAEALNADAETAAVAGDLEKFKTLKRQASDAEALAYVLNKRIEQNDGKNLFSKGEIDDAWKDYAAEHNKILKAKLKKFNETKGDLLRQYAEMVAVQRETCAVRERLARYIGVEKSVAQPDYGLAERFPFDALPCKKRADAGALNVFGASIADPDAAYYLASLNKVGEDLYKDPEARQVVEVVEFRHA